ncbi:unnamed protein product [Brassica oleracea]
MAWKPFRILLVNPKVICQPAKFRTRAQSLILEEEDDDMP